MQIEVNREIKSGFYKANVFITKDLYLTYYNGGKNAIDYRLLEYGVGYEITDPSTDFNLLRHIFREFIMKGEEYLKFDSLNTLIDIAIPTAIEDDTEPKEGEGDNYFFGSYQVGQRYLYVFVLDSGVTKVELYDKENDDEPGADMTITMEGDEIENKKVVYLSFSMDSISDPLNIAYDSWMKLINPVRKKPTLEVKKTDLLSEPEYISKRGSFYFSGAGNIFGTEKITSPSILTAKKNEIKEDYYSPWKTYDRGERVKYSGGVMIFNNSSISKIELKKGVEYVIFPVSSTTITSFARIPINDINLTPHSEGTIEEGELKYWIGNNKANVEVSNVSDGGIKVDIKGTPKKSDFALYYTPGSDIEINTNTIDCTPKVRFYIIPTIDYISLRSGNLNNRPSEISAWWGKAESLSDYFTRVVRLSCEKGSLSPSEFNISKKTESLVSNLTMNLGYKPDPDNQESGVIITRNMDPTEEWRYRVEISKPAGGEFEDDYEIKYQSKDPDINILFPQIGANRGVLGYTSFSLTEFYEKQGQIDSGITIGVREVVKEISDNGEDIQDFIENHLEYSCDIPGVEEGWTGTKLNLTSPYQMTEGGEYTFTPVDKKLTLLVANARDWEVDKPYQDDIDYKPSEPVVVQIYDAIKPLQQPEKIWINKEVDEETGKPVWKDIKLGEKIFGDTFEYITIQRVTDDNTSDTNKYKIQVEGIIKDTKIDIK